MTVTRHRWMAGEGTCSGLRQLVCTHHMPQSELGLRTHVKQDDPCPPPHTQESRRPLPEGEGKDLE